MSIDDNSFCITPWLQLECFGDIVRPCCYFYDPEDNFLGSFNDNTIKDFWNCDNMKQLRSNMLAGKKHPGCKYCYEKEEKFSSSRRKVINNIWVNNDKLKEIVRNTLIDGTYLKQELTVLDLKLSNVCNFKCKMCDSDRSTNYSNDPLLRKKKSIKDFDKWFYDNLDSLKELKQLVFLGGEPLLQKEHYRLLELLVEHKIFPKIFIQTNGSILKYGKYQKQDIFNLWNKFPRVWIGISIDGFGTMGEYIRTGYNDNLVLKNIKDIKEVVKEKISVCITVQAYNVFFITEIFEDILNENITTEHNIEFSFLLNPRHLQCCVLPDDIKEKAITKILNSRWYSLYPDRFQDVINSIRKDNGDNQILNKQFIQHIKELEINSDIKLVDYFPEMKKYMED